MALRRRQYCPMVDWGCSRWFVFDILQYVKARARNACVFVTPLLRKISIIWVICAPPPKTAYFAIPLLVWSAVLVRRCSLEKRCVALDSTLWEH